MPERAPRTITPFWHRIPRFFLYPLQPCSLILLFAVAVPLITLPFKLIAIYLTVGIRLGFFSGLLSAWIMAGLSLLGSCVGGLWLLASELQALIALGVVALLYSFMISCHLTGYVVYQHQHALGYSIFTEADAAPALGDYQPFLCEENYPAAW